MNCQNQTGDCNTKHLTWFNGINHSSFPKLFL